MVQATLKIFFDFSALFIDDNLRNVKAAEEHGMNSIHFQNADDLRGKLIDFGVI